MALSEQEEFELLSLEREKSKVGESWVNKVPAVSVADSALALGSSAVAAPIAGLAGLAGAVLPGPQWQGADVAAKVQNAMTYSPRTSFGGKVVDAVSMPFEYLAKKADAAGGAVTDATGSPVAGTAVNTAIQALPIAAGAAVPKVGAALRRTPNAAAERVGNLGYKTTPEEADAGIVSKTLASLSGEPRLARKISRSNEAVTNDIIAKDLRLPEGTPLDHAGLEQLREQHGAAYETLRQSGQVTVDRPFMNDLREIVKDYEGASKDFPRGTNPVMDVYQRLTKNKDGSLKREFDANSAVSEIKNLRRDAQRAFAGRDFELGHANLDAAVALENILDRHVSKPSIGSDMAGVPGDTGAMQAFRDARQQIAKSYDAERALGPQGDINPQTYAKLLKNRKPLSGGALDVAEAARDFPRSLQKPTGQATGPTLFDAALAIAAKKWPAVLARSATRSLIASDPYQSAFIANQNLAADALANSGFAPPATAFTGLSESNRHK